MNDRVAPQPFGTSISALAVVTVVGVVVRASVALSSEFPLNDGGLFYQMTLDLRTTWPFLPVTTTYNGLGTPFAYPPLGFYLGGVMHDVAGGIDTMRLIPLVLSCLTVPAVYLLARSMCGGILLPAVAATAFALTPRSYEWLLMGGGLTRALGLLIAVIALWLTWRLIERPSLSRSLLAGIAGGLTVLAHPQSALFVLIAGLLFVGARVRTREAFAAIIQAVAVAAIVISPWILAVVFQHGLAPILSASGTQPGLLVGTFNLLALDFNGSRVSPILGMIAVAGIILSIIKRRWLLPVWFAAVLLLDSRGGATYVTVPASILAAQAFVGLVIAPFWRTRPVERLPSRFVRSQPASAGLAIFIFLSALTDALGSQLAPDWPGVPLTEDQRQGMAWVAENGPDNAKYVVVTGRAWAADATAEWFPVLADARSVATVQGTEWLGTATFDQALESSDELRECAVQTDECIEEWADKWSVNYSHVYLPKGSVAGPLGDPDCCVALRKTLHEDPAYEVIYDGIGATIFERTDG